MKNRTAPPYVLLVEDDRQVREVLLAVLTSSGIPAVAVRDGDQALELAAAYPFRAVLSDYNVAGVTGLELMEGLHNRAAEAILILMTGEALPEDLRRRVREAGVRHILEKPFPPSRLLDLVESFGGSPPSGDRDPARKA